MSDINTLRRDLSTALLANEDLTEDRDKSRIRCGELMGYLIRVKNRLYANDVERAKELIDEAIHDD